MLLKNLYQQNASETNEFLVRGRNVVNDYKHVMVSLSLEAHLVTIFVIFTSSIIDCV